MCAYPLCCGPLHFYNDLLELLHGDIVKTGTDP